MHQRGQTITFEIRLKIGEHAAAGLNDSQIASVVGCEVGTVRKWRRRSQQQGRIGLTSHMGRPARGPGSTFPAEVTECLLHLRKLHPGWGRLLFDLVTCGKSAFKSLREVSSKAWRSGPHPAFPALPHPARRATIKAHSTHPNCPRPYGRWGAFSLS